MTSTMVNEFPTLDLDELEATPLRPAVYVSTVERGELPAILAAGLPGVVHARPERGVTRDVHEFVDTTTGAAVRYVLTLDARGQIHAALAESGPAVLFDRIVALCGAWEHAGRPDPVRWSVVPRGGEFVQSGTDGG